MADKNVNIKVTANVDSAVGSIKQLEGSISTAGKVGNLFGSQVSGGIGQVQGMVGQLSGAFQGVSGMASGAAAAVGGIAIAVGATVGVMVGLTKYIGSAIERTVEWNSETKKLAKVLNTTQEEATALAIALDDSFVSSDTYLSGVNKLTKGLESNEKLLKSMGVSLRETDGSYRNTNDIMLDTLKAFSKMENSTEKNIALQKIFGKSWQEMLPALEVANKIESAREEVEKFGLATDPKTVKAYREALDDVGDVFDYLKIAVGKEFMPVVTELLAYLGQLGKAILPPVIDGVKFLASSFEMCVAQVKASFLEADFFFNALLKGFGTVADVAKRMLLMDFSGAKRSITDYSNWVLAEDERVKKQSAGILGMAAYNSMKRDMPQAPEKAKSGFKPEVDDPDKRNAAKLKAEKELLEYKLACYDKDIAAAKGNYDEQIRLAKERQALIVKTYGLESKEAINAEKIVSDLEKKKLEEINKVNELKQDAIRAHAKTAIDIENDTNIQLRNQKRISEEELINRTIANNQKLYELEIQNLQERLEVAGLEPAERQKIMNDIEALQDNHNKSMGQLNAQLSSEMQRTDGWDGARQALSTYIESAQNSFQQWGQITTQILGGVESSLAKGIGGLLSGTMSIGNAIKSVWQGILGTVAQSIGQIIAKYITLKIAKAAMAKAEAVSAGATAASSLMTATAEIHAAHDWIPFVGVGIANGFVALMNASFTAQKGVVAGLTAFATGGLISSPTMALMGEAGPELVAPENDFKHWAKSLRMQGADLQSSISSRQDSASFGYSRQVEKYARKSAERASEPQQSSSPTFIIQGAIDPVSTAKQVKDILRTMDKNFS